MLARIVNGSAPVSLASIPLISAGGSASAAIGEQAVVGVISTSTREKSLAAASSTSRRSISTAAKPREP